MMESSARTGAHIAEYVELLNEMHAMNEKLAFILEEMQKSNQLQQLNGREP